ncbi:MAG: LacI family DNA-binding transcriptional regulator [Pseudomonadota bacterium]
MARSRPTLRDVAERTGVHTSTVSRALNPDTAHRLSPDVVAQVREAAAAVGYRPHGAAASLRTGLSRSVAVVLPDLTNPVFPPIVCGIEDTLAARGFLPIVANTGNDVDRYAAVFERLMSRGTDGFILASARRDDPIVDHCVAESIPLVVINRTVDRDGVSAVVNDDDRGAAMAVQHLHALGHRHIAHLGGPQTLSTGHARARGFKRATRALDLAAAEVATVFADAYRRAAGCRAALDLLRRAEPPTAIFCANDLLALGCYDALRELGRRCPEDLSIVGYNDMPFVDLLAPALTTVRIQHDEMGRQAARMLLQHLDDPAQHPFDVVLRPELVVRDSTAPLGRPKRTVARTSRPAVEV